MAGSYRGAVLELGFEVTGDCDRFVSLIRKRLGVL